MPQPAYLSPVDCPGVDVPSVNSPRVDWPRPGDPRNATPLAAAAVHPAPFANLSVSRSPLQPAACTGSAPLAAATPDGPHHWVISDVHGCADSLSQLVSLLPSRDRIVLCGDVINRGPSIEEAMELAWYLVSCGRAIWLMGNHEQALVHSLRGSEPSDRVALAGCDTYRQLGSRNCRRWLERLEQLPLTHSGPGWLATHAGFDPHTWQPHLTIRMAFWQAYDGRFGEVIVGHTPGPEVRRLRSIVLTDTGACYGGPLTAYCPETRAQQCVPGLRSPGRLGVPLAVGSTPSPR